MSKGPGLPLISFVVLNWNDIENTKECIRSINEVDYSNKELIIVDNGSADGSKDYLRSLDDIRLVDLPENTGFTGGHIAGRKVAKGEYLAIINNDLVLDKNWVKACLETFKRHKDVAIVGGKAFKWNKENPLHNIDNEFYSYQEVDPSTGQTRTLLVGEEECAVDSISGAALLIKQSGLSEVGYFEDSFFAYYEETDLIARLLRKSLRAYYNPAAFTWHKIAASTDKEPSFYLYMMHRNRYLFAYRNLEPDYLRRFLKNYRNEVLGSLFRYLRNPNDLDAKCKLKAYVWTRKNKQLIKASRAKVQKLGGRYVDKLKGAPHEDVTIVIPCYNYAKFVKEAIDSALQQVPFPAKVIVINDGSTDNSKEIIDKYKDNSMVEIVHKQNSGVIDSKNLGIKLSKTYWTVFLDADDKLDRLFLRKTLDASKNGAKDIVYTDMHLFGAFHEIFRAKPFSVHTLLKTNYINNSTLIKTSLLKQVGGYKAEMNHGLEDWELYITLVEAGAKPQYVPQALIKYRQHDGALGRNIGTLEKSKELKAQMKSLHRGFYRRHSYFLAVTWYCLKLVFYLLLHPRLILMLLKVTVFEFKQALARIFGKALTYMQKDGLKE